MGKVEHHGLYLINDQIVQSKYFCKTSYLFEHLYEHFVSVRCSPEMQGKREPIDNTDGRFSLFPLKDPLDQLHDEDSQLQAHTK